MLQTMSFQCCRSHQGKEMIKISLTARETLSLTTLPFSSGERNDKSILNGQRDIVSYNITKPVNPAQLDLLSLLAKKQNKADGD
jgi:hypothetical protein